MDITRLKSGVEHEVMVSEVKTFTQEELQNTPFLELNSVEVKGTITKDNMENYVLDCTVTGEMILPCAITLRPVVQPFSVDICGNIEQMLEEIGEIDKKMENTIDIFPIIWENILVEIPSRVVSEDAENFTLEGNGWKLCTEEQNETINPELQKLRDLLK